MFENMFAQDDGTEAKWEDILMALYLEIYGNATTFGTETGYKFDENVDYSPFLQDSDKKRTIN